MNDYLLDNQQAEAGERFGSLAELFDPGTFRHFETIGVTSGWRCWEVGAGGLSVPRWLAARTSHVLATDIDVSWLRAEAPIEVREHDVARDEPPPGGFDLVHARLVLVHVAERERALRSMVAALRPGGWLVIEDADTALQPLACPEETGPAERLANKIRRSFRQLLAERGADLSFGRTLPRLLRSAGLTGVCADAYFPIASPACRALEAATIRQVRGGLVAAGLATEEEIETHLAALAGGALDLATAPMISAWGRRPVA
ncbi:methyltransferase domain-containing protein [Amycolatopsis sp. K13G38]|uniref:Methyltransferase domain-containing protein n=1 Tax=Amycolatopsis acididurans TaxID=2724524 RepID=A0ABX1JBR5_9PSEU|nr:class I SAM-dependent methyltransferase [Amycolatopsis acididurans]NKQ57237.1 methyltransferase domain-containing protein [Amycolatopsis acididurans]